MDFRMESDSIGTRQVPVDAYYGVQTLRASENFNITGHRMHKEFIKSLAQIKKAAAIANTKAGLLNKKIGDAVIKACDEIIQGNLHDQFIIDPIQGGAGTSANMNANEVIANRAIEILDGQKGDYSIVHPNDHVNMGQSTNDVFPTAGKITALKLFPKAIEQLTILNKSLEEKAKEFNDVIKMGRTQLQDAVPVRLGQEFKAYSSVVKRDISRLEKAEEGLKVVNMGGTAIGTGLNADEKYFKSIVPTISSVTGIELKQADDLIDATQNLDCFVSSSVAIKTCAVNLSKMSNDLRLMSSGPRAGFEEINLPPKQNGSSIMPGKINPVIPEVMNQVAFNIIGNDVTVTMAAEAGQLELNAFEPVIFFNLFESIETLTNGVNTFVNNCISGITANKNRCRELVDNSVGIVTAICPYIGYKKSAKIAKTAIKTGQSVKKIILQEGVLNESQFNIIMNPVSMTQPGISGKYMLSK
ncbi:MAG TPA: aspartate ammonia-lyase [Clostridiaceae bacterium]|nr:aspartate ammonia-lyase [Clostridiaceae bacterium]